jgi:hypothetical protein
MDLDFGSPVIRVKVLSKNFRHRFTTSHEVAMKHKVSVNFLYSVQFGYKHAVGQLPISLYIYILLTIFTTIMLSARQ